MTVVKYDEIW